MNEQDLIALIATMRSQWRNARTLRLFRKMELDAQDRDTVWVRHDREFLRLKKIQRHYTRIIRMLERRLNKKMARYGKKES
jgi:hypothetical protein